VAIHGLTIVPGGGKKAIEDGTLLIQGDKIIALGKRSEVLADGEDQVYLADGRGYWAMPGLINAHTHVAMGFFRGLGQGRDQMIESFFFPAEKALTSELLEPLSYSYIYAGLRAGVTTFGDHYYHIEGVGKALDRFGVRGVIGETVADLGGAFPGRGGWTAMEKLLRKWPFSSRITPAICPHAADTVSPELLKELAQYAKKNALPLHMHLSQTAGERARVLAREGVSPVRYAAACGALSDQTLAVHLVSVDDADIGILKAHGTTAGLSPASQILYEKLAPIEAFMAKDLPLALGTDCAASNDDADMLAEMRLLSLLAKMVGAPSESFEAETILNVGTSQGARALGLSSRVGTLAPGMEADIVFLEEDLGSIPAPRPHVNLLFSMGSRQVRHVMVGGRWVLWDRVPTLVSPAQLKDDYLAAAGEIHRRIGRAP
jgi:5-methylthioadenosine/S-adenosylhomocysteine deaminase